MTIATVIFVVTAATAMLVGCGGNADEMSWPKQETDDHALYGVGSIARLYIAEVQLRREAICVVLPEFRDPD